MNSLRKIFLIVFTCVYIIVNPSGITFPSTRLSFFSYNIKVLKQPKGSKTMLHLELNLVVGMVIYSNSLIYFLILFFINKT